MNSVSFHPVPTKHSIDRTIYKEEFKWSIFMTFIRKTVGEIQNIA